MESPLPFSTGNPADLSKPMCLGLLTQSCGRDKHKVSESSSSTTHEDTCSLRSQRDDRCVLESSDIGDGRVVSTNGRELSPVCRCRTRSRGTSPDDTWNRSSSPTCSRRYRFRLRTNHCWSHCAGWVYRWLSSSTVVADACDIPWRRRSPHLRSVDAARNNVCFLG